MKLHRALSLKIPLAVLLLILSTAIPAVAQSRVYQWKDANGVVHYGDSARGPAKSILIKPTSSGLDGGANRPAIDEAACAGKREQLKRYSSASRVTETNALGETRDYDDAQIKKLIETTEAAVRSTCGEN
ncbi:DUF4124 domain-containing protein [Nevskia sp.]|uniref:DUF4124 domain-containing protein n=1 Tax=Nevskia sp. TaxID=1929292 RepID=UPI0025F5D652|nr:DUF4124 domain-containing protein [Nevskia sp.]